jgi:sugar/nucleoside kinase (ribokinase family)
VFADGHRVVAELPDSDRGALIDSTGAGDAFAAGVLAARLRGDADPRRWLQAGNILAAQAIALVGARPPGFGQPRL